MSEDTPASVTQDDPWLTPDQLASWICLNGLLMWLMPAVDAQLKRDAGINFFEYSVLVTLSRDDRAMQLSDLAIMANGSLSRLSHAVTRLEKQGWVQRRACPGESRAVEAVLTEAGRAKLVATAPGHAREVRRLVVDTLDPEELEQMGRIAYKIFAAGNPAGARALDRAMDAEQRP